MGKFDRKNPYANGIKQFTSKYDADSTVFTFTIKKDDLALLQDQLEAVVEADTSARVEVTYKQQSGKFGDFLGGKMRLSPYTPKQAMSKEDATDATVEQMRKKRVK